MKAAASAALRLCQRALGQCQLEAVTVAVLERVAACSVHEEWTLGGLSVWLLTGLCRRAEQSANRRKKKAWSLAIAIFSGLLGG